MSNLSLNYKLLKLKPMKLMLPPPKWAGQWEHRNLLRQLCASSGDWKMRTLEA